MLVLWCEPSLKFSLAAPTRDSKSDPGKPLRRKRAAAARGLDADTGHTVRLNAHAFCARPASARRLRALDLKLWSVPSARSVHLQRVGTQLVSFHATGLWHTYRRNMSGQRARRASRPTPAATNKRINPMSTARRLTLPGRTACTRGTGTLEMRRAHGRWAPGAREWIPGTTAHLTAVARSTGGGGEWFGGDVHSSVQPWTPDPPHARPSCRRRPPFRLSPWMGTR